MSKFRPRSFFQALFAIAMAIGLSACGDSVSKDEADRMVSKAAYKAQKDEAAMSDAKLSAAKDQMKKLAKDTARQGDYAKPANCNVLPNGFSTTSAAINFSSNAPAEYHAACTQEVAIMNAERQQVVARAKASEARRIAAVQAKANKVAAAKAPPKLVKPASQQQPRKG